MFDRGQWDQEDSEEVVVDLYGRLRLWTRMEKKLGAGELVESWLEGERGDAGRRLAWRRSRALDWRCVSYGLQHGEYGISTRRSLLAGAAQHHDFT